jgi:predicted ATPase/DNA-binding SARP family transcriptional activator
VSEIEFRVLGPIEVVRDGTRLSLGGPRPRAVLARLLLAAGRWVSLDALVDAVWGDDQPTTAVKTVQKYISHLRAGLGAPDLIVSRPDGYELATENVDSRRFERLIEQASAHTDRRVTVELLDGALALWRGDPYGDLPDLAPAEAERQRLVERRLQAIESLVDARLALGQHAQLTGWLQALVADNPLRERLWGALMLALYRSGRQADALAAYGRVRALLVTELGSEPTPELRAVHELILRQEDSPPAAEPAATARPQAGPAVIDAPHPSRRRAPVRPGAAPARLTSFVGRDQQIAELTSLLATERLVTLTGPAGAGKTRLALELIDDRPEARFVELVAVAEPARVVSTVAAALKLREQPGVDLLDVIADHLVESGGPLVLDNCEHVVDAVARLVTSVLRCAPDIRVLATSRQSLGVAGEVVFDVPPLAVPATDDLTTVEGAAAVTLLVQRARAGDARFVLDEGNAAAAARIVRRLDGLPLAIELAAARLRVFDPARLADLLDDRFRVLVSTVRDTPARHQTLLAAVAWSYDALEAPERKLFRDLSLFEGGFSVDGAERVNELAVALLPTLVDRSMVAVDVRPDGRRYRLLETLREYGRAQLEPEETVEVRLRQLAWAVELVEAAVDRMRGPAYSAAVEMLDAERDNLWSALQWSLGQGHIEQALRLVTALSLYWDERACFDEGLAVLQEALAHGADQPAPLRSAAYAGGARLAMGTAEHELATYLARQSLELAEQCGHQHSRWRAQELLGMSALYQGDYATALSLLTACQREYATLGLDTDHACVTGRLGHLHRLRGDYPTARAELEASLDQREQLGDISGLAWVLWQLGILARYEGGQAEQAADYYRRAIAAFEGIGDIGGVAHVRYGMGDLARLAADHAAAAEHYEMSLAVLRGQGDRRCQASIVYNLGMLALAEKDRRAAEHLRHSIAIRRDLNDQAGVAECLEGLAAVAERDGDAVTAVRLLGEGAGIRDRTGAAPPVDEARGVAELIAALRRALTSEAFETAWSQGYAVGYPRADTGPEPDRNRRLP